MCDIIQPCSNQKIIADAFKNAKAWLPVAQKAMEEYMLAAQRWLSDPKKVPKLSSKAARALKANFGWTEDERLKKENLGGLYPNTPRNVIKVIGTLRAKIDVRFAAECGPAMVHPALNPKHAGDLSKVMAFSMQDGENCFGFTPDYFKADPVRQAKTILHEMCHAWAFMTDHAYEGDAAWPLNNPRNTENNADSYACLIRDLRLP